MAGDILCRLPSLADRACFRSVCRSWRLAAQKQLPPAFPWLTTSWNDSDVLGFISLPDGALHRLPARVDDTRCCNRHYTSEESLVYEVYNTREDTAVDHVLLVDPFSETTMTLPKSSPYFLNKLLLCSDNLVAAILYGRSRHAVAFSRPGAAGSWSVHHPPGLDRDVPCLDDIALHGGKLYAFYHYDLYAYDLRDDDDGAGEPKFTCLPCCMSSSSAILHGLDFNIATLFLVPSWNGNKLFVVVHEHRRKFTVLQLEADHDNAYRWSAEMRSLDDELLFRGIEGLSLRRRHARKPHLLYHVCEYNCFIAPTHMSYDEREISDAGVYDMSSKTVRSIFPHEPWHKLGLNYEPKGSWIFPSSA
ncbi:hypothetical protein ZWY2020_022766 [Hordeum vulgare]|nr:hypothetical protein ZWY2020_022766 [Hordeum vulgare]